MGLERILRVSRGSFASAIFVFACSAVPAAYVDVRIPSPESTDGGTLAARVFFPDDPADFRYGAEGGAPMVVISDGSYSPGFVGGNENFYTQAALAQGLVFLRFIYPGGTDIEEGVSSDGTYDHRGDRCHKALRDALRFGAAEIPDADGAYIHEKINGRIRQDLRGVVCLSLGCSTGISAMGRYGDEMPAINWVVMWEGGIGSQTLAGDAPLWFHDPNWGVDAGTDGIPNNDTLNGAYRGFAYPVLDIDYTGVRFDPDVEVSIFGTVVHQGLFYFDNNGNNQFDRGGGFPWFTDTNGDGRIDESEDFALTGISEPLGPGETFVDVLSLPAMRAAETVLANQNISTWPAEYLSPVDTEAYWALRDATQWSDAAMDNQPSLRAGIVAYSDHDHYFGNARKDHIRQCAEALSRKGRWVRLNPDAAYVQAFNGATGAVDNPANIPLDGVDLTPLGQPDSIFPETERINLPFIAAAELADRTLYGNWNDDLDEVLQLSDLWVMY